MTMTAYFRRILIISGAFSVFMSSWHASAETAFFRVLAPEQVQIVGLSVTGELTWQQSGAGGTCQVQKASSLLGGGDWRDYILREVNGTTGDAQISHDLETTDMPFSPGGIYTMGDALGEGDASEGPCHTASVDHLLVGATEVTLTQWTDVRGWAVVNGYDMASGSAVESSHPVTGVTWFDAVKWCNARSQKEGLTPCYYTDAGLTLIYSNGVLELPSTYVAWDASGYRLPTECEWEHFARGGRHGLRFPWGATISHSQANYQSEQPCAYDVSVTSGSHPQDGGAASVAGAFDPNGYGIHGVAGNVREWCWDWYDHSNDECGSCAGSGHSDTPCSCGTGTVACQPCGGSGEIPCFDCDGSGNCGNVSCTNGSVPCATCGGELLPCAPCGSLGEVACGDCGGDGEVMCDFCFGQGGMECFDCFGMGTCQWCAGTGGELCYSCNGMGACSICWGGGCDFCFWSGMCSDCGGSGYTGTCFECWGSGWCFYCNGTGFYECFDCNSQGYLSCATCSGIGSVTCDSCGGAGGTVCTECIEGWSPCDVCAGSGFCLGCTGVGVLVCPDCTGSGTTVCQTCGGTTWLTCSGCSGTGEVWTDHDYYSISPSTTPRGPVSGDHRVVRGGSSIDSAPSCRLATRHYADPNSSSGVVGFRVVRTP